MQSSIRSSYGGRIGQVTLLLLCLLAVLEGATAQRTIASLGSKLQKLKKSKSEKTANNIYVEGEEGGESFDWAFWGGDDATYAAGATIAIILWASLYLRSKTSAEGEDGEEIVIENGHVKGCMDKVELIFSGLRMELNKGRKKKHRILLDGSINGVAKPGRMMAIMGPSGAGKSTVLHALAGKIKGSSKVTLEGSRFINDVPITGDSMVPCALVEQEVSFFPHMTVRETLDFRVELKLGTRVPKSARHEIVDDLLAQMRLEKAAETKVGGEKVRGISGGERRRLAIACELISSPSVIFLDEPTSGLDSTAAAGVVETLRGLADTGKTVVAVIHQPSQHVFASFDDLLLVSEGKQMYFGEVSGVRQYMNQHVSKAPDGMGTAEHILDCISKVKMVGETEEQASKRIEKLGELAKKESVTIPKFDVAPVRYAVDAGRGPRANMLVQFKLLFRRALRENFRGKARLIIELVKQVSIAIVYGSIYSLGSNQASIQDRYGLLSLIAIGSANIAIASTIRSFPKEKAIVSTELSGKLYATLPYFIGKAISEIPQTAFFNSLFGVLVSVFTGLNNSAKKIQRFMILNSLHGLQAQSAGLFLGAVSPDSDTALAAFPAILVLNLIFDGKNISEENTPKLLRWIPKVSLIRWGFEGLCLNEFEGLEFDTKGPQRGPVARNGEEALSRFGLGGKDFGDIMQAQIMITSACWFLSYIGLTLTRQRFQVMDAPSTDMK